ncbi:transmembrane protein 18-domain-containing protein [Dichotomocladium elegans]|nr:transmembrane protein 18-domain-containing protein [Dichotomocladium elegans]
MFITFPQWVKPVFGCARGLSRKVRKFLRGLAYPTATNQTVLRTFFFIHPMANQDDLVHAILQQFQRQASTSAAAAGIDRYIERTVSFFRAIDWSQHWLQGLIAFHIVCFFTTIALRNHHNALSIFFFIILGLAAMAHQLNNLGQQHWQKFASANYFDDQGLFIVSVYAFPLIFNGFFSLIFVLRAASKMMVAVKRAQLRQQMKNKTD